MGQEINRFYEITSSQRIPLILEGNPGDGSAAIDRWFDKVVQTLNLLPRHHLEALAATPEAHLWIGSRPTRGGGALPRGARLRGALVPNTPFVHLSYAAMRAAVGSPAPSYTLLHEMGHHADWYDRNTGSTDAPLGVARARDLDPLGTLAMLWRYHGGGTKGPSEHLADTYADYFYNEIGGNAWGQVRRVVPPCPGGCSRWGREISRSLGLGAQDPPGSANQLIGWRYDALFRTPAFAGVTRAGTHRAPRPASLTSRIPTGGRTEAMAQLHTRMSRIGGRAQVTKRIV